MTGAPEFSTPTADSTRSPVNGCFSAHRTNRPWQGGSRPRRDRTETNPTTRVATCAPATTAPAATATPTTMTPSCSPTTLRRCCPTPLSPERRSPPAAPQRGVRGTCRVICFQPPPRPTLAELPPDGDPPGGRPVGEQTAELGERYRWVQVFENKGLLMGASNPHPHGQIWALDAPADRGGLAKEEPPARLPRRARPPAAPRRARIELQLGERVVVAKTTTGWPWSPTGRCGPSKRCWCRTARADPRMPELTDVEQRRRLAGPAQGSAGRYDNLFETSFPYSMGWHGAPRQRRARHWQLHGHAYPAAAAAPPCASSWSATSCWPRPTRPDPGAGSPATGRPARKPSPAS